MLVVGAATRQRVMERDRAVADAVPLLARATPLIGHFQIRNRGTVGGSLAHADPASEYPAVALALDAELEIAGNGGTRCVPADEFFAGTWTTAIADDEMLVSARFPVSPGPAGFAIEEVARRHGDFALAGAACAVGRGGNGALALFGVGSTPVRIAEADEALRADAAAADVARVAADATRSAGRRPRDGAIRAAGSRVTRRARRHPGAGGTAMHRLRLTVNGERRRAPVDARVTLADFLREQCALTGTHLGCEHGVCGACTVLRRRRGRAFVPAVRGTGRRR